MTSIVDDLEKPKTGEVKLEFDHRLAYGIIGTVTVLLTIGFIYMLVKNIRHREEMLVSFFSFFSKIISFKYVLIQLFLK